MPAPKAPGPNSPAAPAQGDDDAMPDLSHAPEPDMPAGPGPVPLAVICAAITVAALIWALW